MSGEHRGRHPSSEALDLYFRRWLERLGGERGALCRAGFAELFEELQVTASPVLPRER